MFFSQILVSEDAALRLKQIRVGIKAGIKKGDRDSLASVIRIGIQPHMCGHYGKAVR
jgi:hypothetical protein